MTHDPVAQTAPHKVVIMARGLGTRMRKSVEGVSLTADQAAAASAGVKAMISLDAVSYTHLTLPTICSV